MRSPDCVKWSSPKHGNNLSPSWYPWWGFYSFPTLKVPSFAPELKAFPQSMAHFSQNSSFPFPFLVNIIKSRKKFDFWIDFTESLAYNR